MISAIWTVPLGFDLGRRNAKPATIRWPENFPKPANLAGLNGFAIFQVAAREPAIIRPLPSRIKLLMDGRVLRRVVMVLRQSGASKQACHYSEYRRTHRINPLPDGWPVKPESLPMSCFGQDGCSIFTP